MPGVPLSTMCRKGYSYSDTSQIATRPHTTLVKTLTRHSSLISAITPYPARFQRPRRPTAWSSCLSFFRLDCTAPHPRRSTTSLVQPQHDRPRPQPAVKTACKFRHLLLLRLHSERWTQSTSPCSPTAAPERRAGGGQAQRVQVVLHVVLEATNHKCKRRTGKES